MIKIGKYNVNVINLGNFALDGGAMFGVVPKNLWQRAYQGTDELNRIPLSTRILLIQNEKQNILVDTGNGMKWNQKIADIYKIDYTKDEIDFRLAKFNLKKSDITDVILTHLHFDHCGGATEIINDKLVPTFPNAKYYVQKQQFDWANNPTLKDKASFMKDNFQPLIENNVLNFTDGFGEIFEGIEVIPVDGHTKHLQMIRINDMDNQSEINNMIYTADLVPTSAHIPLPYVMGYDNYPLTTLEEKFLYIPKIHTENWLICFEHDAYKQAGFIGMNEKGYFLEKEFVITE